MQPRDDLRVADLRGWWHAAPMLRQTLACLALALLTRSEAVAAGESSAQQLHRRGVHCMEEIERNKCAVEHFENLLKERTEDRELITDAMLRLIKIYGRDGDDEAIKAVMRKFWDAGKGRFRKGQLPYTTRFIPSDFTVLAGAHMPRLLGSPLSKRLPDEMREYVLTCDDDRRIELEEHRNFKRAERRAKLRNQSLQQALTELSAEDRKKDAARAQRASTRGPRPAKPVFADGMCATVRAFGEDSVATWTRVVLGFAHGDWRRSAAVAEVPGLAERIARGVASGKLVARGPNTWTLVGLRYHEQDVVLANFELDELVLAPAGLLPEIAQNHARNRRSITKELDRLVAGIPVDAGCFAVAGEQAVRDLGFAGMPKARRKFLELLLPHPEGLQVAGVAHEYFGMFLRMPTDTPVKAGMMVDIARRMIDNQASADPDSADALRHLDIAQASDRRALLLGYVLSPSQIEQMMLE